MLNAVDAGQGALIIGRVHVGIYQIALDIIFITRVGILVEEALKQVNALVKRGAGTLAHAYGIIIVGRLPHAAVTLHGGCTLEGSVGAVQVIELTLGLTQVEVSALGEGIALVAHLEHIVDHRVIIAIAVVEHTHCVGSGAVRLTLTVVKIAAQVGAGLVIVAHVVIALAHKSVQLGVKVVILLLGQQSLALFNDLAVLFLIIVDLGNVVLGLITQLTALRDVAELFTGGIVIATGIIEISLVEIGRTAITRAVLQGIILALSLVVVTQPQVTVGAAVFQVLITVQVERAIAHERIAQQSALPLPTIKVVVTHLHLGLHGKGRRGITLDELLQ